MNSVLNRASLLDTSKTRPSSVQKLPASYYYSNAGPPPVPLASQHGIIKWRHQSTSSHSYRHSQQPVMPTSSNNSAKFKFSASHQKQQKHLSRSTSTDFNSASRFEKNTKLNNSVASVQSPQRSSRLGKIESPESIIQMHKFFKEKRIYSDPNDNYKRRTIVLVKSPNSNSRVSSNMNSADFGFHLQSYGLVNTSTQLTEFICFVENVQAGSPAKHAGLSNGDVVLAIDCIPINEFKNLHEIMTHVRGKNELRLVIMCENVCKKIQLQQRLDSLKSSLATKQAELERVNRQQDALIQSLVKKASLASFTSPTLSNSSTSSSMTSSSISESHLYSPVPTNEAQQEFASLLIKNSTPNDLKDSLIISPASVYFNEAEKRVQQVDQERSEASEITGRLKSRSSPNGTARIQVDLDFTSPIIQTSTSTYSTCSSSSARSTDAPSTTTISTTSMPFQRTRQLAQKCLQETSRIVRSASSSSMNILSNFKLNRSSRSRNSSICSTTMNDSIDSETANTHNTARLNKFLKKPADNNNNNKMFSDLDSTSDQTKPVVLKKAYSNQTATSRIVKKQPQLACSQVNASSYRTLLKKLNSETATANLPSENRSSKFTILQNRPRKLQQQSSASECPHRGGFFTQPFSPILADQSSLLNEIIDSGIDVGIGLVNSPNSSDYYDSQTDGVAKIISDGGFTYMRKTLLQQRSATLATGEESNDEFLITKL